MSELRDQLVSITMEWEKKYDIAPRITGSISEYDAAMRIGLTEEEYSSQMQTRTAVSKGHDFIYKSKKYQVKACRPSGKHGSKITWVKKPRNYDWDYFIWMQYNTDYTLKVFYKCNKKSFIDKFGLKNRLSPSDIQEGQKLFPNKLKVQ
jgi:hypothetical protein